MAPRWPQDGALWDLFGSPWGIVGLYSGSFGLRFGILGQFLDVFFVFRIFTPLCSENLLFEGLGRQFGIRRPPWVLLGLWLGSLWIFLGAVSDSRGRRLDKILLKSDVS